ncbi:MAG TPA: PIG-L family deacetylase [Terriglobia bacterium]|nr:PIG-L family deacetylase [Terriglobia bacterium]
MIRHKYFQLAVLSIPFFAMRVGNAKPILIEGAPADTGYNVGTVAIIRATLKDIEGDPHRYAVFANIQYVGTTAETSVEMDRKSQGASGEWRYEAQWPIPSDAPTGLYSVNVKVEDRRARSVVAMKKLPGFAAYKKLVRISRVTLDKTFYAPGETIECEVALQNLTNADMKNLRVEFSNANYPWISTFSGAAKLSGQKVENPELGLKVMRDHLNIAASSEATIPMMPAGIAAFLQGTQVAVLGAGGPARNFKLPPPEVDTYTIAVWNAERTVLYDMQFSPQVVVRDPARTEPKPYSSHNYTHAYNDEIDYKKYREFYAPGEISPVIRIDSSHTLYRPGDVVEINGVIKMPDWNSKYPNVLPDATLQTKVISDKGKVVGGSTMFHAGVSVNEEQKDPLDYRDHAPGEPGHYSVQIAATPTPGGPTAKATTEIAVNNLPTSVLVFCPHEDDEHPYAGLIRAAVEAGVPVRVVFFTGGDVGECERYFNKPCGPNEAREFGTVRMEESMEALEHIGLARSNVMFLGLPDGGSGDIWSENIKVSNPFLDIYLATDHAPYENLVKPNLPYARDAVIAEVKQIITDFHPALIATPHPDERHVDHRTANWFVLKACQELLRAKAIDPQTVILADQSYGAGGFKPAPYHYEKYTVYLSGEAAALKQEMSWIYQSQDGNLAEGARQTFADLPREEIHYRIVDWQQHAGWNE